MCLQCTFRFWKRVHYNCFSSEPQSFSEFWRSPPEGWGVNVTRERCVILTSIDHFVLLFLEVSSLGVLGITSFAVTTIVELVKGFSMYRISCAMTCNVACRRICAMLVQSD